MDVDGVLKVVTNPIVQAIITGVAGIAVAQWRRYSKFYKEVVDIGRVYLQARDPKSPGGKKLTKDEYAAIGREIVDVIQAGAPLFKKRG